MPTFVAMKAPRYRSFLGALLFGAFALTVIPRELLHHCDQAHIDHHHPDQASITGDLDCEVCEVMIAVFDGPVPVPFQPHFTTREFHFAPHRPVAIAQAQVAATSRGPPRA
jgi:hypothetical protein